ncbi:hypothetical protein SAMN05443247_04704 [Bradyrhizobium erythrophlei]|nr:hypothetical protein SAMN05443247_04704 [Bradyrhizobium erythrophlei]
MSSVQSGNLTLDGNIVSGTPSTVSYNITSTTVLTAQNNICINQTSGFCWTTAGAQGTLRNNTFRGVALANVVQTVGSSDLGRSTPSFVYNANGVIQNLVASETGSTGSKYVLREWFYDIAGSGWIQQRMLTGN